MRILLVLIAILLICVVSGQLIAFSIARGRRSPLLTATIGYAYLTVAFYVFYMASKSAQVGAALTLGVPPLLGGARILSQRLWHSQLPGKNIRSSTARKETLGYPLIAALLVVAFAAWPYLAAGWGHYWHSGNEDMEDALNGRDAYLNGAVFGREYNPGRIYDPAQIDLQKLTETTPQRAAESNSYRDWYAGDHFRFQYSSQAFWSVVFQGRFGLDLFLEHALADLVLMSFGVYVLARRAFGIPVISASMAAGAAVLSAFYFGTFVSGHEGSMIYGALIPTLLYLIMAAPDDWITAGEALVYSGLLLAAVAYSYPHPAAIALPPAIGYRLWKQESARKLGGRVIAAFRNGRLRRVLGILVIVAVAVLLLLVVWHVTAGYRIKQATQYRSWGYTHDWYIVPIFLGLIPSPVVGSIFAGAGIGLRTYWALTMGASVLAVILAVFYLRFRSAANRGFLGFFGVFWVLGFLVFRFAIVDSYYLYKFLYTHQFLFVIGIAGFCGGTKSRIAKALCGVVLAANLAVDVAMAAELHRRPYNQGSADLASLSHIDPQILRSTFVGLGGGDGIALRQTLEARGIQSRLDFRQAEYAVVPSDPEADVLGEEYSETLAPLGRRLAIRRIPSQNALILRTPMTHYLQGERAPGDPVLRSGAFLWVGSGVNDYLGIYIVHPSPVPDAAHRYLRVCLQPGPSAEGSIPITMSAGAQARLARFNMDGVRCVWLPSREVLRADEPVIIHSGATGKSILPFDDRILLYRVFAVGWADQEYDERALSFLNLSHDIVSGATGTPSSRVRLGNGWDPYESSQGEHFRWAGPEAELVVDGPGPDGLANIAMTVQPGPSHGPQPFRLEIIDRAGSPVFESSELRDRTTLHFQLHYAAGRDSIYTLRTNSEHRRIAADPRILDYRVFKIDTH